MSVDAEEPQFLTVKETARRFDVHENTIRNWVRQGILPTARVPGSRFHRFDARDVERLVKQRGETVSSVEREHRTIGPELVDASQLSQWAGTKDAQHRFPELVRRLLASTPGVTNVSVRSGEGVAAPGWDGRAESTGTSFLPAGSLAFELGVDAGSKAKADKEFRKRRENPQGVVPEETVFIFATPRRWAGAAAWATTRRAEGVFRDVQVLDADDLEGWLHATPAVHHWISEHLGRRPQDAETLDRWWSRFQTQTDPPLPPALFLAGRDGEREQLVEFFGQPPGVITIQAAWRDDAIAFVCATVDAMQGDGSPVQPPLLVRSAEVWDRVVTQPGRMTLLPLFEGPDLASASAGGHHVVIPVGREQVVRGSVLELPRLHRQAAGEALEAAGLDADRSYRLTALARRNMPSFVRELSRDPRRTRPSWSELPHAAILAPLMLVGAWTPGDDDTASRMVDKPWTEIERTLRQWRTTEDPPFVTAGSQWHVAASEEAFLILRDALTPSDLERWRQIAIEVLLETDPRLELEPEERPMAGIRGVARKHSEVVRRGIAEGVALVGSADDYRLSDGISGLDHARRVVGEILGRANADESGQIWRSLADVLPLLAEAAPGVFLDAVHDDLDRDAPLLATMFQDNDQSSWLYSSSPHTGLLWALEILCWSPDYLLEASRALARLQLVDPGGRLSNRPLQSLDTVLVGWIRHTAAQLDLKVGAVERICRQQPEVGWKLLAALWPSHHAAISPPSTPRFHDWKPESRNVSIAEWVTYIGHLVRLAIDLAGTDPSRWAELVERIASLPPAERDRLLDALDAFADPDALDPASRLLLWDHLHKTVAHHRRFPSAEWSMDDGPLSRMQAITDRLEPATNVERFAYLFDWRPDLPDVEVYDPNVEIADHAAYDQRLLELRTDAVTQTLEDTSLDGLRKLAERSAAPHHLGWVVGAVANDELTPDLLAWIESTDPKLQAVGTSWASRKLLDQGIPWLRDALARPELSSTAHRAAVALCAPATSELWDTLIEIDGELSREYWERMKTWNMPPEDVERAVRELLGRNRAWIAVDLLAMALHRPDERPTSVTPALVQDVLDAALRTPPGDTGSQSLGYEIGQLLDYLAKAGSEPATLARYEFAFFRLLEHHRHPRALFAALAGDPGLFVELVSLVYKPKNAPHPAADKETTERASHAWWILHAWRELPGQREDGTIDAEHLNRWVSEARLAFADSDRADIGDDQIGHVLAASPPGSDGIRPAEPVRDIIETLGNQNVAAGFHTGVVNDRGFTSRGVYDGGQQERVLAARYREWAQQTADRWPRTSRLLRGLGESYEREAQRADARAEITGDTE